MHHAGARMNFAKHKSALIMLSAFLSTLNPFKVFPSLKIRTRVLSPPRRSQKVPGSPAPHSLSPSLSPTPAFSLSQIHPFSLLPQSLHPPCLRNSNSTIKSQASLAQHICPGLPNQVKAHLHAFAFHQPRVFFMSLYGTY